LRTFNSQGAYKVGFYPQWIVREYISRNEGATFDPSQMVESPCVLLGHTLNYLELDQEEIPSYLLDVRLQPEVGEKGFTEGAKLLTEFFKKELEQYLTPELNPIGRRIIECFCNDGTIEELDQCFTSNSYVY